MPRRAGKFSLRTLCPYLGWSDSRVVRHTLSWAMFENFGAAHCGHWAARFAPVSCVGRRGSLILAPFCQEPFVTILLHGQGPSRAAVVPRHITPSQFHSLTNGPSAGPPPRPWTSGPHAQMRAEQTHLQLRNGDHFGFSPDINHRDMGYVDWPMFTSPEDAVAHACWSLPFTLRHSGVARLWSRHSDRPEQLILRENTWWDPDECTFRDAQGQALTGTMDSRPAGRCRWPSPARTWRSTCGPCPMP